MHQLVLRAAGLYDDCLWILQGSPVWMEHAAAIDVPGMEAAGISLEDFVYYHCRVRLVSLLIPLHH